MLEQIINNYIAEKNTEIRDNTKFRVSDAGRCRLMRFWKRQGKPASDLPDERARRVFEVGHVFHVWLQNVLQEKGFLAGKEFRVEDEHKVGHVDAFVKTDDGLILYDFKTVHSRKFHYKRKNGNNDMHYVLQVATYEMMLPFPVVDAKIAYISKDDLCIEEVSIYDSYQFANVKLETVRDWDVLIEAWSLGLEPEANPKSWECKYCIYKSTCKEAIK